MKKLIFVFGCLISYSFYGQLAQDYFDQANNNESDWQYQIDNYTKGLRINPVSSEAYYNRGVAYEHLGNYEDAIADYIRAIEIIEQSLDPSLDPIQGLTFSSIAYVRAYNNKGRLHGILGNYEEAIADCTRAMKIDTNHASAYYERGLVYGYLKNYDDAIDDFTRAINIESDYANAYYNRGIAKHYAGFDDGCSDLIKANELGGVGFVHPDAIKAICD